MEHLTLQIASKNWKLYFYWKHCYIFLIWPQGGFPAELGCKAGVRGIEWLGFGCSLVVFCVAACVWIAVFGFPKLGESVLWARSAFLFLSQFAIQSLPLFRKGFYHRHTWQLAVDPGAKIRMCHYEQTHFLWGCITFTKKQHYGREEDISWIQAGSVAPLAVSERKCSPVTELFPCIIKSTVNLSLQSTCLNKSH